MGGGSRRGHTRPVARATSSGTAALGPPGTSRSGTPARPRPRPRWRSGTTHGRGAHCQQDLEAHLRRRHHTRTQGSMGTLRLLLATAHSRKPFPAGGSKQERRLCACQRHCKRTSLPRGDVLPQGHGEAEPARKGAERPLASVLTLQLGEGSECPCRGRSGKKVANELEFGENEALKQALGGVPGQLKRFGGASFRVVRTTWQRPSRLGAPSRRT